MNNLFAEFTLLNFSALFGLLSIIVPILIHLFNRNKTKTFLVGNIDFIKQADNQRTVELKLSKWLLLIIRIMILSILTLILSQLVKNNQVNEETKTHVFVSPDWLNQANQSERLKLINQHFQSSQGSQNSDNAKSTKSIKKPNFIEHHKNKIFLLDKDFTPIVLSQLSNMKRLLPSPNVRVDSLLAELQNRELMADNNIIYSTTKASQFLIKRRLSLDAERFMWQANDFNYNEIKVNNSKGNQQNKKLQEFNVAVFYSSERNVDYQFLQSALETLKNMSKFNFSISSYTGDALKKKSIQLTLQEKNFDWVFWLNDKPVDQLLLKKIEIGQYLLKDNSSSENDLEDTINQPTSISIDISGFWINFIQRSHFPIKLTDKKNKIIWKDSLGKIILSSITKNEGRLFQFNSRFNPQWNDLVSGIQFPIVLASLFNLHPKVLQNRYLSKSEAELIALDNKRDKTRTRSMETRSMETRSMESKLLKVRSKENDNSTPYQNILLVFLAFLWFLERLIGIKFTKVKK